MSSSSLSLFSLISLSIILFGCPNCRGADENELILVQALWRHGDRSPTRTFKTDIYQEDDWPQGWGQLTKDGMAQHVKLGKKLREKYMDEHNFISKQYKSHEIYVRSTDFNRTLISAISNLIGFYGPGMDDDYPKELVNDWPGWYVPLPVHTISGAEDFFSPGEPKCARQEELNKLVRQAAEYKKVVADYKWLMDFLEEKTGEKLDPFDVWIVSDAFFIEEIHKPRLVDWANQTILEAIKKLEIYTSKWLDGIELSPVDGFDFSKEIPRIRGGPILWKMISNMQEKLHCERKMNAVLEEHREIHGKKSPLGAPLCKWINPMRYFVYSAHDSTIAALFSAFGFPKTNYDEDGRPPYSACVTVELWRKKSKDGQSHFVKVNYWRPNAKGQVQMVEITKDIEGCKGAAECTLDQFIERSKPYQMGCSPAEYCQKPLKPPNPPPAPTPPKPQNSASMHQWIWIMLIAPFLMASLLWMAQ